MIVIVSSIITAAQALAGEQLAPSAGGRGANARGVAPGIRCGSSWGAEGLTTQA